MQDKIFKVKFSRLLVNPSKSVKVYSLEILYSFCEPLKFNLVTCPC